MASQRSPLFGLLARALIAALVLTSLPVPAPAFARVEPLRGPIHADGIGSIRRLTDEAGNITDGYTYSAFGELLAHTGSDPQPYAFTGEPLDPNSGFQYHRARWMDPRTGRFTGMDPFAGALVEPATLHRYGYANGDPVIQIDPSGRQSLAMSNTTGLMVATLAVATILSFEAARTTAGAGVIEATTGAAADMFEEGSFAAQRAVAAAELAVSATYRTVSDLIDRAKEGIRSRADNRLRWTLPKVVPIPEAIIPAVARHVATAQLSHPMLLTRTTSAQARINRRRATAHLPRAGLGQSWDEYPFASSIQGGFGASVQVVPLLENLIQGGIVAGSYALEGIGVGDHFLVLVVPK